MLTAIIVRGGAVATLAAQGHAATIGEAELVRAALAAVRRSGDELPGALAPRSEELETAMAEGSGVATTPAGTTYSSAVLPFGGRLAYLCCVAV